MYSSIQMDESTNRARNTDGIVLLYEGSLVRLKMGKLIRGLSHDVVKFNPHTVAVFGQ